MVWKVTRGESLIQIKRPNCPEESRFALLVLPNDNRNRIVDLNRATIHNRPKGLNQNLIQLHLALPRTLTGICFLRPPDSSKVRG